MDGCQYKGKASIIGQVVRKKKFRTSKLEQVIVLLQELL